MALAKGFRGCDARMNKDEIIRSYVKKLSESGLLYSHKQIELLDKAFEDVVK